MALLLGLGCQALAQEVAPAPSGAGQPALARLCQLGTRAAPSWDAPAARRAALDDIAQAISASALPAVRVDMRERYVPDHGPVELLAFFGQAARPPGGDATTPARELNYRVVVVDAREGPASGEPSRSPGFRPMLIPPSQILAQAATQGAGGTDWKSGESSDPKTVLRFTTNSSSWPWWWHPARLHLIACAGEAGTQAVYYGTLATDVSSGRLAFVAALGSSMCLYFLAAFWTFRRRQAQNVRRGRVSGQGTHHAGLLHHLNPVVLTAGGDGRGSATKLQILFFSLIVFGVVAYIWMRTGRLTAVSANVLLLMGISGAGAALSAATDVSKNRISFGNWAWLVDRGWLPKGGIAEVHLAGWSDIVATNGEFDVYRFQMVAFTLLVGLSLLQAGAKLNDLSAFDVPDAFLAILGLSQVVYIAGKWVAPPNISELDKQIDTLRAQEKALREATESASISFDPRTDFLLKEDESIRTARVAFSDYLATWKTTSIMFSETLGREVPEEAEDRCPPFYVPTAFRAEERKLPPAKVGQAYAYDFVAVGGSTPFAWERVAGHPPPGLALTRDGRLHGTPASGAEGRHEFQVEVRDSAGAKKRGRFELVVDPADHPRAGGPRMVLG